MVSQKFIVSVRKILSAQISKLNFSYNKTGIAFERKFTEDVIGRIAFSEAKFPGLLKINPIIGIEMLSITEKLESFLEEPLLNRNIINVNIGYLSQMAKFKEFDFLEYEDQSKSISTAKEIADLIDSTAVPYIYANTDLESISTSMCIHGPQYNFIFTRPLILAALNRQEEANEFVKNQMAEYVNQTFPFAATYTKFAVGFMKVYGANASFQARSVPAAVFLLLKGGPKDGTKWNVGDLNQDHVFVVDISCLMHKMPVVFNGKINQDAYVGMNSEYYRYEDSNETQIIDGNTFKIFKYTASVNSVQYSKQVQ